MPTGGTDHFARFDSGGLTRDPATIFRHLMPGATDVDLLQNAVTLDASAVRQNGHITITVSIVNDMTGHHVPTDSPLRHLILGVEATDTQKHPLILEDGPTLPEWCGTGDPVQGYYAGLPGTAYAKILEERWTNVSPTGAYWNHTRVVADNRIPAMGSDNTVYAFTDLPEEDILINVTLLYRRSFIELIDQKGWEVPDILMEEVTLILPGLP